MKLHEVAKQLDPHAEIRQWLDDYRILNYTIRPDGVVDVDDRVDLRHFNETILPIQFGTVTGRFDCSHSTLASIKGMPQFIGLGTNLTFSDIKSFSGIDKIIKQINGAVNCDPDVTHILGLLLIKGITSFHIDTGGPIDKIMNRYVGTGDILSAQDELIDAGFIDQARL
jgi:hypothetical protein